MAATLILVMVLVITIITAQTTTGESMGRMFMFSDITNTADTIMIMDTEGLRVEVLPVVFMEGDFTEGEDFTAAAAVIDNVLNTEIL